MELAAHASTGSDAMELSGAASTMGIGQNAQPAAGAVALMMRAAKPVRATAA